MSYWKYLLILIFGLGIPTHSISSTAQTSGDWAYMKKDNRCLALVRSPNLQYSYILYKLVGLDQLFINWISGPGVEEGLSGTVIFKFDNSVEIPVDIDIDDPEDFQFTPVFNNSSDPVLQQLKKGSTLSMFQNGKLIAGPFSLKGSGKALKLLADCK